MGFTLKEVNKKWSKQRSYEFKQHIIAGFANPLFLDGLRTQLKAVKTAPIMECREMCSSLSSELKLENNNG